MFFAYDSRAADHCQTWSHMEEQANKGSFNLQKKAELLALAQKAKPAYDLAKVAMDKADAEFKAATAARDAADAASKNAKETERKDRAKAKEAKKAVKAAGKIRPKDKGAVAAAWKLEDAAKKVSTLG